jgi:hypothetical protein
MRQGLGWALFAVMAAMAPLAQASYHTFEIAELYSNADGTIQFVLLHESAGANGQDLLAGHTLSATHVGTTKTFVFPASLPSAGTAGRYVLVATQGYVDAAASLQPFASVYPDYVVPNQFLPTDGGVVNYAGVDEVSFGPLPGDGSLALFTPTGTAAYLATNEARNFAGAAANLPALAVTAVEYYNAALRHYFIGNLQPDIDDLVRRQRPVGDARGERLPLHVLHHDVRAVVVAAAVVNRGDIRVRERRRGACFAAESLPPLVMTGRFSGKDFEGDVASEPRIAGAVDLAHATRPEQSGDLVRTKAVADPQVRHMIGAVAASFY